MYENQFDTYQDKRVQSLLKIAFHGEIDILNNINGGHIYPKAQESYFDTSEDLYHQHEYTNMQYGQLLYRNNNSELINLDKTRNQIDGYLFSLLKDNIDIRDKKLAIKSRVFSETEPLLTYIKFNYVAPIDKLAYFFAKELTSIINIIEIDPAYSSKYDSFRLFRIASESSVTKEIKQHYRISLKWHPDFCFDVNNPENPEKHDLLWTSLSKYVSYIIEDDISITSIDELKYFMQIYRTISY